MRPLILILLAPLTMAGKVARKQHAISTNQGLFGNVLATCPPGYEVCEDGCMLSGDTCCNDGTGESCDSGYYCIPDSCCPNGEVCDWDPTEDTCDFTELPCGDNCVPCGDYCMPITGTCCSSEGTYCPDFGTCMSGDTCCYLGDNCESSNINSTATPTSKSLLTPSVTSSAGQGSPPASTPAGFGITLPTSNSHGASKTTQPSITVTRTATVTATATPSTIPLSAGQACSYCRVTGLAITGFAVAFSLLA